MIAIKRVYEPRSADDGFRVLVYRLWPRGLSKEAAAVDLWLKDAAPSTALRRWFHQQNFEPWDEFKARYFLELKANPGGLAALREAIERGKVTLLYASRNEQRNHALALKEFLAGG